MEKEIINYTIRNCDEIKNKIDGIISSLSEDIPNAFNDSKISNIFLSYLKESNFEYFLKFQAEYIKNFIDIIKNKIPINDIEFLIPEDITKWDLWDENNYVLILVCYSGTKNSPILQMNLFTKKIYVFPNEFELQINTEIEEYEFQIRQLELEIEDINKSIKNPYIETGISPIKIMGTAINKKKIILKMKTKIEERKVKIHKLKIEIQNCLISLDEHKYNFNELNTIRDRYISRLNKYFNFTNYENDISDETDLNDFFVSLRK